MSAAGGAPHFDPLMSGWGQTRKSGPVEAISVSTPKSGIAAVMALVSLKPISDITHLFDHLVGTSD
jgi:hypothetical protein